MIQKYIKIQASKENLLQELGAFDKWPQWWPGVESVKVIKDEPTLSVIDMVMHTVMTINMTLEIDRSRDDIIKFKQLKGWFKSYYGDWTLLPSPDGVGVTLKMTIEIECGMLIPKSMVYSKLGETLGQLGEILNKRLQGKTQPVAEKREQVESGEQKQTPQAQSKNVRKLVHIFQTKKGLEVWVSGRRYLMKSI